MGLPGVRGPPGLPGDPGLLGGTGLSSSVLPSSKTQVPQCIYCYDFLQNIQCHAAQNLFGFLFS